MVLALEARKPRSLTTLASGKEPLERFVCAAQHILKDLAMDVSVFFSDVLDVWQLVGLIVVGDRLASLAVGVPSLLQSSIVQFPYTVKCPVQSLCLFFRRVHSEFVGNFRHASQYTA